MGWEVKRRCVQMGTRDKHISDIPLFELGYPIGMHSVYVYISVAA